MAEKETVFSSKIKYNGVFSFKDLYQFCYDWLTEETGLDISEKKYSEKISGDSKRIDVEWEGAKKMTDYFKFEGKVEMQIIGLTNVEVTQDGAKIKTNKGSIEMKMKGTLVRDYKGKFEIDAFRKFLRGIYEKWVISSRVDEYEEKIAGDCDKYLDQAKKFLDLEGDR